MGLVLPPYGLLKGQARPPNYKQACFHQSDATFKLFLGGVGSGKTHAGARELIEQALSNGPDLMYIVGAPSEKIMRTATFPHYVRVCSEFARVNGRKIAKKIRTSPQNRSIVLQGNITIEFVVLKNPDEFAGPTIAGFHMDEAALVQAGMRAWEVLLERLRETRANRLFGIVTTTPRGPVGVVQHFLDRMRESDPEYDMVVSRTRDNLINLGPRYIQRQLAGKSERQVRQQLDAEVLEFQGAVYSGEFCNVASIATGWKTSRDIKGRPIYLAIDWGPNHPHALWIAHDDDEDFDVVFGELCPDGFSHREFLERCMDYQREMWGLDRDDIAKVYCDFNPASAVRVARSFFGPRARRHKIPVGAKNCTGKLLDGIETVSMRLRDHDGVRRLLIAPDLERTGADGKSDSNPRRRLLRGFRLYQWEQRSGGDEPWFDDLRPNKKMNVEHGLDALRAFIWQRYRWQSSRSARNAFGEAA